jgi:hypothetical protein
MSNNNWNINAELAKLKKNNNKPTIKVGNNGKVYIKVNNKFILWKNTTKPSMPVRKYTRNQLNIIGPSTRVYNNVRLAKALNVYNNAIQKQLNALEMLRVTNRPAYNNAVKHLLSRGYVLDKLKTVGRGHPAVFKNYTASNKNNQSIRGFVVFHNSPSNNSTRVLNLIVTRPKEKVGEFLIKKVLENASRNGKTLIRLNSVKSAVNFYKRFGFKPIGNTKGFTPMQKQI